MSARGWWVLGALLLLGTLALWVRPWADERSTDPALTECQARLVNGAAVQICVRVPEGQPPPHLVVSAWHEQAPAYSRSRNSRGEAVVTLTGLAPGPHRLQVGSITGATRGRAIDETIVVEGTETIERTLDLR